MSKDERAAVEAEIARCEDQADRLRNEADWLGSEGSFAGRNNADYGSCWYTRRARYLRRMLQSI